jgi:uncharacterized membrane protein
MAKNNLAKENTTKTIVTETEDKAKALPFTKMNYILVLVGVALIALGMILMIGGGSDNPDVFNPQMFDFRHITLAPILVLLGFVVEIVAIFWKRK